MTIKTPPITRSFYFPKEISIAKPSRLILNLSADAPIKTFPFRVAI